MPGKETTDAIFVMRNVVEKYQAKKKKLYNTFVDLEKEYDSPERCGEMGLRKLGVDPHIYGIVSRGLHCSLNICWTKWRLVCIKGQLLYANDLLLMAPTMEQLGRRVTERRASLLDKVLKVNTENTKVMVNSSGGNMIVNSGK